METSVKQRLIEYLRYRGIGRNKFEDMAGISSGYITNIKESPTAKMLVKILSAAPDLNEEWLLHGKGEMVKTDKPAMLPDENGIPLIPVNAIGGALSCVSGSYMEYECEKYIVPQFSGADFLIRVQGDSMVPKYIPGDIVACKRITDRLWFQWGKAYVVDTRQGVLIKRIEPSEKEGCISMRSENEKYKPFDLPEEELNGVAIVVGVIRVE